MSRRTILVFRFCLAALVFASGSSLAAQPAPSQEGVRFFDTGPLRIREQFLLGQGFLAFEPTSADVLGPGHWQLDLVQSVTNTWVHSDAVADFLEARTGRRPVRLEELRALSPGASLYYADGELHRTSFSLRRGLGHGLQVGLTVPLLDFSGGLGDPLIEGFHDTFGFGQSGRRGVPRGAFTVYLRDRNGRETYRRVDPSPGIGDISLSLKTRLPAPRGWRLAVDGQVKLPTGDERSLYGTGSTDLGVELLATRYFARSCFHGGLSLAALSPAAELGTRRQTVVAALLGYEHAWGRSASVLVQGTISQSPFRQLAIQRLDEVAYLVDLGIKRGFQEGWVGFVAASENLLTFGSSADFGLHVGLTWTR